MNDEQLTSLRNHVVALLAGGQAYPMPERIFADIPPHARGARPEGIANTIWDLLEHMRRDQRDILDFGLAETYELKPASYLWPETHEPPSESAWDESVRSFLADLDEARRLAADPSIDLLATVRHATHPAQTWLRELILISDHNAYHLGQIVQLRKLLGVWD
jgi:hypothetical protein